MFVANLSELIKEYNLNTDKVLAFFSDKGYRGLNFDSGLTKEMLDMLLEEVIGNDDFISKECVNPPEEHIESENDTAQKRDFSIRVSKVARELNISVSTIIEFLLKKGFQIESTPNAKMNEEMYDMIKMEYKDSVGDKLNEDSEAKSNKTETKSDSKIDETVIVCCKEETLLGKIVFSNSNSLVLDIGNNNLKIINLSDVVSLKKVKNDGIIEEIKTCVDDEMMTINDSHQTDSKTDSLLLHKIKDVYYKVLKGEIAAKEIDSSRLDEAIELLIHQVPNTTADYLFHLGALNLLNAAVKQEKWKSKIGLDFIKLRVTNLFVNLIHKPNPDIEIYVNNTFHYFEVLGVQFGFCYDARNDEIDDFSRSDKNVIKPWLGIRLQAIAVEVFEIAQGFQEVNMGKMTPNTKPKSSIEIIVDGFEKIFTENHIVESEKCKTNGTVISKFSTGAMIACDDKRDIYLDMTNLNVELVDGDRVYCFFDKVDDSISHFAFKEVMFSDLKSIFFDNLGRKGNDSVCLNVLSLVSESIDDKDRIQLLKSLVIEYKTQDEDEENNANEIVITIEKLFNSIYQQEGFAESDVIITNGKIVNNSSLGVEVITDDNNSILCNKGAFVGYSRNTCSAGVRVFVAPHSNEKICFVAVREMTYFELKNAFIKAAKTQPKARTLIMCSILGYFRKVIMKKESESDRLMLKKIIKDNFSNNNETSENNSPRRKQKVSLNQIDVEIQNQIKEFSNDVFDELGATQSERVKKLGELILEQFDYSLKKNELEKLLIRPNQRDENQADDNPFISATCEIYKYFTKYGYGAAQNKDSQEIRFSKSVIVDKELISQLDTFAFWNPNTNNIPVVCTFRKEKDKDVALFIAKPGTLNEYKIKIKRLRELGNDDVANAIVDFLVKSNINIAESDIDQLDSATLLAIARRNRFMKNFTDAEREFCVLIDRGYELDSVVKDLATAYQEQKMFEKAISLMQSNMSRFTNKEKAYNCLISIYVCAKEYGKAADVVDILLRLSPQKDKKAQEKLFKLKENILKQRVKHWNAEIPSELLKQDVTDFSGVALAYIQEKSIDEKLVFLNQRIGELKNSPDVSNYYLEKIKLLEERGENAAGNGISRILFEYCKARARNLINDNKLDSAQSYLLESFKVNYEKKQEACCLLLLSICASQEILLSKYTETCTSYSEILDNYSIKENPNSFRVLMEIISYNNKTTKDLLLSLYHSKAKKWLLQEISVEDKGAQAFSESMLVQSKKLYDRRCKVVEQFDKVLVEKNIKLLCKMLLELENIDASTYCQFDIELIKELKTIADSILDHIATNRFESKEETFRRSSNLIKKLQNKIKEEPTVFGKITCYPLLGKLDYSFKKLREESYVETMPIITVEAMTDARMFNGNIEFQLLITNAENKSSVYDGELELNSINKIKTNNLQYKMENPLEGGTSDPCSFIWKIPADSSITSLSIEYTFSYNDVWKESKKENGVINIFVGSGGNFIPFENPYLGNVKGNAVKDKAMFKGRDGIVDEICKYVQEQNKGYVLYGQKRCGKSSVLYHISEKLRSEKNTFAADFTMGMNIVQDANCEHDSLVSLFYLILSEIARAIKQVDRGVFKEKIGCVKRRAELDRYPEETFRETLDYYRDIIHDDLHFTNDKIVLVVDEFTYLYYHILEENISPNIMMYWKDLIESGYFSFVFAGQDAMPRFMDDFPNVFECMFPKELTYIEEKFARELIEEPIWDREKNISRFTKDAVDKIIKLTACNPFYIMIICSELVKYAHERKRLPITLIDVNEMTKRIINDGSTITRKDFDNLISCGEAKLDLIDKDKSIAVLKEIAVKTRNGDFYYDVHDINAFEFCEVEKIVNDLYRRRVLEQDPNAINCKKYRIKVELFKLWLLNHE